MKKKFICTVCGYVYEGAEPPEKCPVCGSYMVEKRGRKGEVWHLCANETCHHRIEVQASEEEADE